MKQQETSVLSVTDEERLGFPVELFVDQDKIEDFICAICTEVCRDAVETPYVMSHSGVHKRHFAHVSAAVALCRCSHIFCAACLDTALELKMECPLDHIVLKLDDVRPAGYVYTTA